MKRKRKKTNKLQYYRNVQLLAQKHYIGGVTTWKGIWREYINPMYPMEYNTFLRILGEGNLINRIENESTD